MSMPFYVSPEQQMRDKADYARSRIARESRTCVVLQYAGGILMVTPNRSTALHKISELYDRIAFAASGRYNEFEALRKAGVTYADITGYQYDRRDVTARGLANWYAQTLGTIFTDSNKPYEVEIVVAEVAATPDNDQIYRITFDGSVSDEPGFVAFGGQADHVSTALKERFHDGMSLTEALGAALAALAAPPAQGSSSAGNGAQTDLSASQLEVAILDRARAHRTFRRLHGPRLEELLTQSRSGTSDSGGSSSGASGSGGSGSGGSGSGGSGSGASGSGSGSGSGAPAPGTTPGDSSASSGTSGTSGTSAPSDEPPTGPSPGGGDGIPRPPLR